MGAQKKEKRFIDSVSAQRLLYAIVHRREKYSCKKEEDMSVTLQEYLGTKLLSAIKKGELKIHSVTLVLICLSRVISPRQHSHRYKKLRIG